MEYNNLSREMLSLHVPGDYRANINNNIPSTEARNISFCDEDSSLPQYSNDCNDEDSFTYSTKDGKTENKSIPFVDSEDFSTCTECRQSKGYAKPIQRPKVYRSRAMEARINQPQTYITNSTGNITHIFVMNNVGYIQMGQTNIVNITTTAQTSTENRSRTTWEYQQRPLNTAPRQGGPMLKKLVITSSQKLLDDRNIEMLCKNLGRHWKDVAKQLGFCSEEVHKIEQIYGAQGLYETIWQFVLRWQDRAENKATFCAMADALIAIRKYDIAVQLKVS